MKVTKYKSVKDGIKRITPYFKHKELDKENKMISLPYADRRYKTEPDYYKDIRAIFCNLDTYLSDYIELEDFIYYLSKNVEIDDQDRGFEVPLPGSDIEYFLIFNDKIWVYFRIYDEYGGFGECDFGVCLDSILVPEGTPMEEVREVKEWLIEAGFKLMK